ncbi:ATP-binding cassette domain-containing protein [Nonomuraea aridisoli]|uniref:ATP-binding cassette domain-containing protein n=1 Tax=Nonomuraea aridisoli TaxID=2070368 RepID=UPI001F3B7B4D|nr:ABC transporter ATP-binding protein [Nonomuraea aridisoli]
MRRVEAELHVADDRAATRVLEYARAQQVLRTFDTHRRTRDLDAALEQAATALAPGLLGFSFVLQLCFAALLAVGVLLATGGSLSTGLFAGLMIVVARLAAIASTGAELAASVRMSSAQLARVEEVLSTPPLPEPATAPAPVPTAPLMEVGQVTFGYGGANVLDRVSFELPERGLTALVGPSGSGKTTVTRLPARFWDVDAGAIRFRGRDVRALPHQTLHVGTAGALLSGGQRQRISIARAILKAAPLTVLDEATAALDPENAAIVHRAISTLARRGCVLVVAHHLSAVQAAETILVLDGGRIVHRGVHDDLMARPGLYADFVRALRASEGWALRHPAGGA